MSGETGLYEEWQKPVRIGPYKRRNKITEAPYPHSLVGREYFLYHWWGGEVFRIGCISIDGCINLSTEMPVAANQNLPWCGLDAPDDEKQFEETIERVSKINWMLSVDRLKNSTSNLKRKHRMTVFCIAFIALWIGYVAKIYST